MERLLRLHRFRKLEWMNVQLPGLNIVKYFPPPSQPNFCAWGDYSIMTLLTYYAPFISITSFKFVCWCNQSMSGFWRRERTRYCRINYFVTFDEFSCFFKNSQLAGGDGSAERSLKEIVLLGYLKRLLDYLEALSRPSSWRHIIL